MIPQLICVGVVCLDCWPSSILWHLQPPNYWHQKYITCLGTRFRISHFLSCLLISLESLSRFFALAKSTSGWLLTTNNVLSQNVLNFCYYLSSLFKSLQISYFYSLKCCLKPVCKFLKRLKDFIVKSKFH